MAHDVDGFGLRFTGRRSWKAALSFAGRDVTTVPVTWGDQIRRAADGARRLPVHFVGHDGAEPLELQRRGKPFLVAVASAIDAKQEPRIFNSFVGVFLVTPTREPLEEGPRSRSILCKIERRLTPSDGPTIMSGHPLAI